VRGFGEEVREFARIDAVLAGDARGQELEARGVELALEGGEEVQRLRGEDGGVFLGGGGVDLALSF
jgi:hypothetical protein